MIEFDAVIALAGDFSPEGGIGRSTLARMETAVDLVADGIASNLIVTGSNDIVHPERSTPLSHLMRDYAEKNGIDSEQIYTEDQACDTVGNALFSKIKYTEPNDWKNLLIVTNEFHLPRSMKIFSHVMGPDYIVSGVAAPNQGFPHQWLWEKCARVLTRAALADTLSGDSDAIKEQLFSTVPRYRDISTPKRILNIVNGLVASF